MSHDLTVFLLGVCAGIGVTVFLWGMAPKLRRRP